MDRRKSDAIVLNLKGIWAFIIFRGHHKAKQSGGNSIFIAFVELESLDIWFINPCLFFSILIVTHNRNKITCLLFRNNSYPKQSVSTLKKTKQFLLRAKLRKTISWIRLTIHLTINTAQTFSVSLNPLLP